MFSVITIITTFIEIFASGILLGGALTLLKKYFQSKKLKDLFSSLAFFAFFLYVAASLASQMMFNLGRELSELILVHKVVSASLLLCATFLWAFVFERTDNQRMRWSYLPLLFLVAWFIYRTMDSSANLIYREGIVEPIVLFSQYVPAKPFFVLVCLLLMVLSFIFAVRQSAGKRTLLICLGFSGLFLLGAMLSAFLYIRFGESACLLVSWMLILLAALDFLLAESIPPESPEARRPLSFLRTRLLFKLLLIFVLLIVILFEATTLATISISRSALSRSIISNYLNTAEDLAARIKAFHKKPSLNDLQGLVLSAQVGTKGLVFVVNEQGELIAHPDKKRVIQRESLVLNQGVKNLLRQKKGGGEFQDELGKAMVGAYVPIEKFGWGLVVEEPVVSAYFELRRLETNSLLFVIAGIVLTTLVGIFFAHSIEKPVKKLTEGTEAVARGDLHWKIELGSADEIGRLAVAFNQMTRDLRESQERLILSEKLASLGTMAAGMAHEIKNPLVSVRTFTQLLQQKWDDPEFRKKFSAIIPQEVERINRIAESLLKFGRPSKPELSRVEVNGLLEEVLMLFESECKKHNIRVTKKFAELPEIKGDAGQLQQAFVNIVKNAIEAMQGKGGALVVKTDLGEVVRLGKLRREGKKEGEEMVWGEEEELEKPIPVVFVEISDTGDGIPEGNLRRLFDPFFTTKMTGTGMGLPITLRIIQENKGSIKVRSQEGKGTTFVITLPQKA